MKLFEFIIAFGMRQQSSSHISLFTFLWDSLIHAVHPRERLGSVEAAMMDAGKYNSSASLEAAWLALQGLITPPDSFLHLCSL